LGGYWIHNNPTDHGRRSGRPFRTMFHGHHDENAIEVFGGGEENERGTPMENPHHDSAVIDGALL